MNPSEQALLNLLRANHPAPVTSTHAAVNGVYSPPTAARTLRASGHPVVIEAGRDVWMPERYRLDGDPRQGVLGTEAA